MYNNLLNGSQAAEKYYNDGATIEFVSRCQWLTMCDKYKHLFASNLLIFRVKPLKINAMLNEIQANRITLDNCPRHRFDLDSNPIQLGEKIECLRCGGKMSLTTVGDYVRGYEASGLDPNDIVSNWYGDNLSDKIGWNSLAPVTCPHCKGTGKAEHTTYCAICIGSGSVTRVNAVLMTKGNRDL